MVPQVVEGIDHPVIEAHLDLCLPILDCHLLVNLLVMVLLLKQLAAGPLDLLNLSVQVDASALLLALAQVSRLCLGLADALAVATTQREVGAVLDLLRVEAALFLVLALALVWLRPPAIAVGRL